MQKIVLENPIKVKHLIFVVEAKKQGSVDQITHARSVVKEEIQDLKEKLKLARSTIENFKEKINVPQSPTKSLPSTSTTTAQVQTKVESMDISPHIITPVSTPTSNRGRKAAH